MRKTFSIVGLIAVLTATILYASFGRGEAKPVSVPASASVTTTTTAVPDTTTTTVPATTTTTEAPKVEVASTVIERKAPVTTAKPKPRPTTTVKPKPAPTTTTTEAPLPLDQRILKVARNEVGKKGTYTEGGFWCAKFASWVALEAKAPGFAAADGPARLHYYAKADGRLSTTPKPGDLIFIDLMGQNNANDYISHVGIVESVESDGVTIHTIEGNADSSGVVVRKTRAIGDGFVIDFAPTSKG